MKRYKPLFEAEKTAFENIAPNIFKRDPKDIKKYKLRLGFFIEHYNKKVYIDLFEEERGLSYEYTISIGLNENPLKNKTIDNVYAFLAEAMDEVKRYISEILKGKMSRYLI